MSEVSPEDVATMRGCFAAATDILSNICPYVQGVSGPIASAILAAKLFEMTQRRKSAEDKR